MKKSCFVIMPISTPKLYQRIHSDDDHFAHVYDHLFKPAIEKNDFEAMPPAAKGSEVIHAEIIRNLEHADLVLCDMSSLNANVFYELGIRTALNKPVCLAIDKFTERVPFDTAILNHFRYDERLTPWTLEDQVSRLADHIKRSFASADGKSSLWKYFSLTMQGKVSLESANSSGKLDYLNVEFGSLKNMLERRLAVVEKLAETPASELARQQKAIEEQRQALKEREEFLDQSEAALFEKMQAQQERETELEIREAELDKLRNDAIPQPTGPQPMEKA